DVYGVLPLYGVASSDSLFPLGLAAANRAIALDSTLAEAYASRGVLLNSRWRWTEAERDFRRAISLDPRYAGAQQWLGEHFLVRGRIAEAVAPLKRATDLDPVSPVIWGSYALALGVARRHDEAIAVARRAVELDSTLVISRSMLGTVFLGAGRTPEAIRELEVALGLAPTAAHVLGVLGYAYAVSGARDNAQGMLQSLQGRTDGDAAMARAHVQVALGDTAAALTSLEEAVEKRAALLANESLFEFFFDPLRQTTRFQALMRRLGIQ
ncbi:MAG TPA: tetratricopeptide repeat protein, partial [Chloroflexota bacterium]|nr:tetratricopeptide repeat protein [Chloroflexota bacterium]